MSDGGVFPANPDNAEQPGKGKIRMRAARKAGELSKKIEKAQGNRYSRTPDNTELKTVTLERAGISTQQASEWERLASVPREEFEEALTTRSMRELIRKPTPVSDDALLFIGTLRDFALGADSLQWVLYRRHAAVPEGSPLLLRDWRPISFVPSTKEILLRCMREKGCKPSHEAQLALDGTPPGRLPYALQCPASRLGSERGRSPAQRAEAQSATASAVWSSSDCHSASSFCSSRLGA
jgi:hypothetical protein